MQQHAIEVLEAALADKRLTMRQLGGLTMLLGKTTADLTLFMSAVALAETTREGSTAVNRMLQDLEGLGYLTRVQRREGARFVTQGVWTLHRPATE